MMMHGFAMRRRRVCGAAVVAAAALGATQASASQLGLVQVNSIGLGDLFNESSTLGSNPSSIAYDGTNVYLGGWNTIDGGSIGIAKVGGLTGAFGTSTQEALAGTVKASNTQRGFDALAWDASTGSLISITDTGSAGVITRYTSDLSGALWTHNVGRVVGGLAIDPVGDPTTGGPVIAYLQQSQGRRLAVALADGSDVYTISGGSNPGGIINTVPTVMGATWRGLAFDSEGNIALIEDSGVAYGLRTGANAFESLDGTAARTSSVLVRSNTANVPIQSVAILEGLGPDGADLLAFTLRTASSVTDLNGNTTTIFDIQVQIRNLDGSITGLTQTLLTGNESGLASEWNNNAKSLAFGYDAVTGRATLVTVDYISNRLDVYQIVPEPAALSLMGFGALTCLLRRRHDRHA